MRMLLLIIAVFRIVEAVTAQADLIAHYTFDVDGSAAVGEAAVFGSAASITADAKVGAGALALSGQPNPDTRGLDGATGKEAFVWASDARTVTFFMKATPGDKGDWNATMISLGSGTESGQRFDIRFTFDTLRLEVQGEGSDTGLTIADASWHHIAVVVNDGDTLGEVEYYLDGTLRGTFSGTTPIRTEVGPLRIGDSYHDNNRDFKGTLDEVRLYNNALNAAEIYKLATIPEPSVLNLVIAIGCVLVQYRRRHH